MTDSSKPLYPRDLRAVDLEPHYSRHASAMTTEQLHSKADIAEQLAWRDQVIESLRARVGELEAWNQGQVSKVEAIERIAEREEGRAIDAEERVMELETENRALQGKALVTEARAESAEARVRELEVENEKLRDAGDDLRVALIAADHDPYEEMAPEDKPCPLCEAAARYDTAARLTGPTPYESRITTLESQLEAAREEAGLEERLKSVLGWRLGTLQLKGRRNLTWHAHWHGGTSIDEGSFEERIADEKTLPALLRAILEVEHGG